MKYISNINISLESLPQEATSFKSGQFFDIVEAKMINSYQKERVLQAWTKSKDTIDKNDLPAPHFSQVDMFTSWYNQVKHMKQLRLVFFFEKSE